MYPVPTCVSVCVRVAPNKSKPANCHICCRAVVLSCILFSSESFCYVLYPPSLAAGRAGSFSTNFQIHKYLVNLRFMLIYVYAFHSPCSSRDQDCSPQGGGRLQCARRCGKQTMQKQEKQDKHQHDWFVLLQLFFSIRITP